MYGHPLRVMLPSVVVMPRWMGGAADGSRLITPTTGANTPPYRDKTAMRMGHPGYARGGLR